MCGPVRTMNRVGIRTSDWIDPGCGCDGFQARVDPEDAEHHLHELPGRRHLAAWTCATGRQDDSRHPARTRPRGRAVGGGGGRRPRRAARPRRCGAGADELGRALHHQPALAHAAVLGLQFPLSLRRPRRSLDAHQPRPVAGPGSDGRFPIMGKLWDPATTVSWNQATTALSNIVTIDESPLLEGLLYVGTDDGLLQVTRTAAKLAKDRAFPGVPPGTYVTDVLASARDANVVFVAAQQLAARRLQAVPAAQRRPRPHVHARSPAICRTA